MTPSSLLSVVVTTKDRPTLLAAALASVARSAPEAEVIVVDDGSGDKAAPLVRQVCSSHGVRLIRNELSHGPSYARNQGLAAASGRYWAALDDDDEWLPTRWRSVRDALASYDFLPDLVAVTGFRSISPDGFEEHIFPGVAAPTGFGSLSALIAGVRPRVFLNTYIAPTALVRRVGGYDEQMRWGEHTDLLIRLAKAARFAGVNEETVVVHVPPAGQGRNWSAKIEGIRMLLAKHATDFEGEPGLLGVYRHVLGVTQLRAGDRWGAVRTFAGLGRSAPTAGRRARALAQCAGALVAGPRLWRWISGGERSSAGPGSVAP